MKSQFGSTSNDASYLSLNLTELQPCHGLMLNHGSEMCCDWRKVIRTGWRKRTRAESRVQGKPLSGVD